MGKVKKVKKSLSLRFNPLAGDRSATNEKNSTPASELSNHQLRHFERKRLKLETLALKQQRRKLSKRDTLQHKLQKKELSKGVQALKAQAAVLKLNSRPVGASPEAAESRPSAPAFTFDLPVVRGA